MSSKRIPASKKFTPFFKRQGAVLYNEDCLALLESLPESSIDLIFADPPYNLSNGGTSVHAGKRVSVDKGSWDKSAGPQEDFDFHFKWIQACKRVLRDDGTIWISGTYHSIYDIAWFKPNAAPNLGCRMFTASHETLLWASKSKKSKHIFNYEDMKYGNFPEDFVKKPGKQMRSLWSLTTPKKDEKFFGKHPTQKPLALLDRIILASSSPGDVVLDPFCGSATTGVSALAHGRKFIGIDSSRQYLEELALPRLENAADKRRKSSKRISN